MDNLGAQIEIDNTSFMVHVTVNVIIVSAIINMEVGVSIINYDC